MAGGVELIDAAEEYLARCVAMSNREAALEAGACLSPRFAPISGERFGESIAQLKASGRDLASTAEHLKDALRLGLADDEHRIDLPRLQQARASQLHSTLRAAWLRPKETDLVPDKGQFR